MEFVDGFLFQVSMMQMLKLQHCPRHFAHFAWKAGAVFSQLNNVDFFKGISLSPHDSTETSQNSINFETEGGQHPSTTRND